MQSALYQIPLYSSRRVLFPFLLANRLEVAHRTTYAALQRWAERRSGRMLSSCEAVWLAAEGAYILLQSILAIPLA